MPCESQPPLFVCHPRPTSHTPSHTYQYFAVYSFGEQRLWWETPKAFVARYMPAMPSWVPGSRGGVFNNPNSYKFVPTATGASAPPGATPISASAYGAT